jgi:class 3 adenylate cyclase
MSQTANVKYVCVDVVGFTKNRSVEAQSDVVGLLNGVITQALKSCGLNPDNIILLPTGDGVLVAIIESKEWDIDVRLSVAILEQVEESNRRAPDDMRKFALRIGVNENVDNLVSDINNSRNVAGAGISQAQRIMDTADANQILVGQTVFDRLSPREKYMSQFRPYIGQGKHGSTFRVYQYIAKTVGVLNTEPPTIFQEKSLAKPRFTSFAAYYVAHAIKNEDFLKSITGDLGRQWAAPVLLFYLATDSIRKSETSPYDTPYLRTWKAGIASFSDQYGHYRSIDTSILVDLEALMANRYLDQYQEYFEDYSDVGPVFVTPAGRRKLTLEWSSIAQEFGVADAEKIPTPAPGKSDPPNSSPPRTNRK